MNSVGLFEIDEVRVSGFSFRGLNFGAPGGRLTVTNSVFENNGESGLHAQSAGGTQQLITLERSRFDHNAANGAVIATNATGSILSSTASHNASVGFLIDAGGIATLASCKVSDTFSISGPHYGVLVRGAGTSAMISNCEAFGVFWGFAVDSGAVAQVVDSTAQDGGAGFSVQTGASQMYVEHSTAANNQVGFGTYDGTTGTLTLSNSTSNRNNTGVYVGSGRSCIRARTIQSEGTSTCIWRSIEPSRRPGHHALQHRRLVLGRFDAGGQHGRIVGGASSAIRTVEPRRSDRLAVYTTSALGCGFNRWMQQIG